MNHFDVAIIGSGPACLFAAMEIVENSNLSVVILEKARRLNDSRNVSLGWLGGSARSSIKIFTDPEFGGQVATPELMDLFFERLREFGGGSLKSTKKKLLKKALQTAAQNNVLIEEPELVNFSEDKMIKLGDLLYSKLRDRATVRNKIDVSKITKEGDHFILETNGGTFSAHSCILGLGRAGHKWLETQPIAIKVPYQEDYFDLGIRLEFPEKGIKPFSGKAQNFRFKFGDFRTTLPTFMGTVETEELGLIKSSNGRSWNSSRTPMVNFGLLKRFYTKRPIKDVYRLAEIVNVLANGQIMREPLSKVLKGETMITHLDEFNEIIEGVRTLLKVIPTMKSRCTVYAPEVRLNAAKYILNENMETELAGLYIVGDMSGWTSSFAQAACSGIASGRGIVKEIEYGND